VLAARPAARGVTIVVQRTDLDPRSARTVARRELFAYDREGLAE
jgi:hypothetical protein